MYATFVEIEMSVEDDKTEIYSILSEPFLDGEEEDLMREKEERRHAEEERIWKMPAYDLSSALPSRPRIQETRNSQSASSNLMSLDFEAPEAWLDGQILGPTRQSSVNGGGNYQSINPNSSEVIQKLMGMVQNIWQERTVCKSENEALQAKLKDVVSQLGKLLVRREADQKKIVGLMMRQQRDKKPPPVAQKPPESPLVCDVQMVDADTAKENGFNYPTIRRDALDRLTLNPKNKTGKPPDQQQLLGLWDPDVQIVSIGFELPEWVTIRLTNTQGNGPLTKTGYLIHLRVLEDITANLKDLTGALSVLETAFANNETLLQREKELRLEAENQVEELRNEMQRKEHQMEELQSDLQRRKEKDGAITENARAEEQFKEERQILREELETAQDNLVDAEENLDYDPLDPTQEKAERMIQVQRQEVRRVEEAIDELEKARESTWLNFIVGLKGLHEDQASEMLVHRRAWQRLGLASPVMQGHFP